MDISPVVTASSLAQPSSATPEPQPDLRPTADAAALARDPDPFVPLPPAMSQQGVIAASVIRSASRAADSIAPVEDIGRTLKPFGISMLPSDEAREAQRDARTAQAESKEAERDLVKAEQKVEEADRAAHRAENDAKSAHAQDREEGPTFKADDEPMFVDKSENDGD